MINRPLQAVCVAVVLLLASVGPARADSLGLGISFLGDDGGTGFLVDYAHPSKTINGNQTLSWLGEFSFFHNSLDEGLFDASLNTFMIQGGARYSGPAGAKATWHAQGLIGLTRATVGGDLADACDQFDVDCGDNTGVLTVGGGIEYAISDTKAVRGQLDFPIFLTEGGGNTTRFSVLFVLKR